MPKVTYFGIFEKEAQKLIESLPKFILEDKRLEGKSLNEWFHNEGFSEYQKAQSPEYQKYVAENLEQFKHLPLISFFHMMGQHYVGLMAAKNAFVKTFGLNDEIRQDLLSKYFDTHILNCLSTHEQFIKIESRVASEFNAYLDKEKVTDRVKHLEKVIELFEEKQKIHPELAEEFEYKLTSLREFLASIPKAVVEQPSASMGPR